MAKQESHCFSCGSIKSHIVSSNDSIYAHISYHLLHRSEKAQTSNQLTYEDFASSNRLHRRTAELKTHN